VFDFPAGASNPFPAVRWTGSTQLLLRGTSALPRAPYGAGSRFPSPGLYPLATSLANTRLTTNIFVATNVLIAPSTPTFMPPVHERVFAWDAPVKEYTAKTGELTAKLTFSFTNTAATNVTIKAVRTSCGCTVARVPAVPWVLAPGTNGTIEVIADLRGKSGIITKTITVDSSAGYRFLTVRVSVPAGPATLADRARNLQAAMVDRMAVFKGDCGFCHQQPVFAKKGEELYRAACGICHEAEHRASMVANLHALGKPTNRDYWTTYVTKGRPNTLMPAWAIPEGGPLNDEQIVSLVDFLVGPFRGMTNNVLTVPAARLQAAPTPTDAKGHATR
jgi:cytochrome c5